MFLECTDIKEFWKIVDNIGESQWSEYKKFSKSQILQLFTGYSAIKVFQISAMWTIWRMWCHAFYQTNLSPEERRQFLSDEFVKQVILRISEVPALSQWLDIIRKRKLGVLKVSEKEFLLVHSQSIKKCDEWISLDEPDVSDYIKSWIGKKYFVTIEYDAQHGNKPKFRIERMRLCTNTFVPSPPPSSFQIHPAVTFKSD